MLDPDAIAKQLNPLNPSAAAIQAGRQVLQLTDKYLEERQDFAIETTLSGTWTAVVVKKAKSHGFFVRLYSFALRVRRSISSEYASEYREEGTMCPMKMFVEGMIAAFRT